MDSYLEVGSEKPLSQAGSIMRRLEASKSSANEEAGYRILGGLALPEIGRALKDVGHIALMDSQILATFPHQKKSW